MKIKRRVLLLIIDCFLISMSYFAVSQLINSGFAFRDNLSDFLLCIPMLLLLYLFFSYLTKSYQIIWRYCENYDFLRLALAAFLSFSFLTVYDTVLIHSPHLLLLNLFSMVTSVLALILIRVLYILFTNQRHKGPNITAGRKRALLIGAGYTGKLILSELLKDGKSFYPVGLIDDDASKIGRSIEGVLILGCSEDIPKIAAEKDITTLIFAIPSIDDINKQRILNICMATGCELKIIPFISQIVASVELLSKMRDVKIEDLLGREPVLLQSDSADNYIFGKVCMVTGGGGSIGSELCRQIASYKPEKLIIVDVYENSTYELQQELLSAFGVKFPLYVEIACVTDEEKMQLLLSTYKVDIIFHAAAHKHVPLMETNPEEAIKNNVCGTLNLVRLSDKNKVKKFILISSDKAVNPTNVMGASKRICEMILCAYAAKSATEFASVRFGNVLGSNGSVIPLFKQQIANHGPVTITHPDIIRYFMTIPEAVSLVLSAAALASGGEIFVLDMGKPVKILDLAEKLIKLSGYEPYKEIKIEFVGLRPGEKLFEELLLSCENVSKTKNSKIFIGTQQSFDYDAFWQELDSLINLARANEKQGVIEQLKSILPNFLHE